MKKLLLALLLITTLLACTDTASAQDKPAGQKWEYAMIKWDGPDRIQYILPDKFDMVFLGKTHPLPKNAQAEEFYLTRAANELAKDGWEAVNINSRRVLFRRSVKP